MLSLPFLLLLLHQGENSKRSREGNKSFKHKSDKIKEGWLTFAELRSSVDLLSSSAPGRKLEKILRRKLYFFIKI
jgi:hypothetical protein